MLNLVIFGPPGAGKGTQSNKIIEKYNLMHLSTGDILRAEIASKTDLGNEAKKFIDKGELVPDNIVIGMIRKIIERNISGNGFILDGFPRTIEQANALDEMLNNKKIPLSKMLFLDVDHEELIKRLLSRGKDSGRSDDQGLSIIEKRINIYHQQTKPVLEYYEKQNKAYKINGIGTVDEIFDRLCKVIDK